MGWTVFPHPTHSPDLAPSDCHLFGAIKDALCGCHLADDSELKQVFMMCSDVEAGNFTTLVYIVILSVGKSVLKIMGTSRLEALHLYYPSYYRWKQSHFIFTFVEAQYDLYW
jgi:hypothetical protein